jgi:hypothetical protein
MGEGRRIGNRYEVTMVPSGQVDRPTGPTTGPGRPEPPVPRPDPAWHGELCWFLDAEAAGSP